MNFILISDPHITSRIPRGRIGDPLKDAKAKLKFIFDLSLRLRNAPIICAGDLFDTPRDITALFTFLTLKNKYPKTLFFTVYGQHDLYFRNKNVVTNIGILEKTNSAIVLGKKPYKLKGVNLYGCSWREDIPKVKESKETNILSIHAPVYLNALFPGHSFIRLKEFRRKVKDFNLTICGDIHRNFMEKKKGKIVCNTGPLMRLESSDFMRKHNPRVYVYNSSSEIGEVEIPCKPWFEVLRKNINKDAKEKEEKNIGDMFEMPNLDNMSVVEIIHELIEKSSNPKKVYKLLSKTIGNAFHEFVPKG